jgi:threonine aldolase
MIEAMIKAPLGDDVLGDEPTVHALEARFAAMMGKPAAVFVPSGTMANQTAIRAHTEPGDEIICHEGSHIIHYEGGGPAALSGCMCRTISTADGTFDSASVESLIRPPDVHFCRSRLLVLENTHNRNGGTVWPMDRFAAVAAKAKSLGLRRHLDGARLWNACVASGHAPAEFATHVDTVSACFSKGLGCPVGSALAGDEETIQRARRARKLFGGGMRQSGILAAAALYALDNHIERMVIDHAKAARFAKGLREIRGIEPDPSQPSGPQTNIVFFTIAPGFPIDAPTFQTRMSEAGVLLFSTGPRRVRAVMHLDVQDEMVGRAIETIRAVMQRAGG